eukprot:gene5812-biopygen4275
MLLCQAGAGAGSPNGVVSLDPPSAPRTSLSSFTFTLKRTARVARCCPKAQRPLISWEEHLQAAQPGRQRSRTA